jgi:beta-xylosidase
MGDFADPFILRDGDAYLAFGTGWNGAHVQVARSTDLSSWAPGPDALPKLPKWASTLDGYTWAPTVLPRPGGYVLYYTTRAAASGFQCISLATSTHAEGPYTDSSAAPLVCQVGDESLCGSIDPSPFVDSSGQAYLLWKSDENSASCRKPPRIWAQRLRDDGLGLVGSVTALLTEDRGWEGAVIEGPAMIHHDGRYFLFYSANGFESRDYAVGYATCAGPMGPCEKKTLDTPWLKSDGALLGPGGQEFFPGPDGQTWMVYHAWSAPLTTYASGGERALRLARVTFDGGTPRLIADPSAAKALASTPQVAPPPRSPADRGAAVTAR